MTREELKVENNKKLFNMAIELFCQYGAQDMTLRMLSEKTGISYRSVIRHFETKEKLIARVVEFGKNKFKEDISVVTHSEEYQNMTGREQVDRAMRLILHLALIQPKYVLSMEELDASISRSQCDNIGFEHRYREDVELKIIQNAIEKGFEDGSINNSDYDENKLACLIYSVQGFFYRIAKIALTDELKKKLEIEKLIDTFVTNSLKCM